MFKICNRCFQLHGNTVTKNIFHAETRSYLILVCLLTKSIWVFRYGITSDIFQTNSLHLIPFRNKKHDNILCANNSVCVSKMFLIPLYQKKWTCHFLWKLICWPFIHLPLTLSSLANLSALFKVYLSVFLFTNWRGKSQTCFWELFKIHEKNVYVIIQITVF